MGLSFCQLQLGLPVVCRRAFETVASLVPLSNRMMPILVLKSLRAGFQVLGTAITVANLGINLSEIVHY